MIIGALNDIQFVKLCKALNLADSIGKDPKFASNKLRVQHRKELIPILQREILKRKTCDWIDLLEKAEVPCGPINKMSEVFSDPQVLYRRMVEEVEHPTAGHIKLAGIPTKFSDTELSIRRPPPVLGQHTYEVLREVLQYDEQTIQSLRDKRICQFWQHEK